MKLLVIFVFLLIAVFAGDLPDAGDAPSGADAPPAAEAVGGEFETPRVWPSTAFLAGAHLPGDGWRIDPVVSNDGVYNTWGVSSRIGPFHITGDERLVELLREIEATIRLQEISKGREFALGLQDAAKAQFDAVKQVATDPVNTVKRLPQGASRFLGRVGNTVKHTVQGNLDIDKSATADQTARNLLGIEKAKRLIAAELGVNPYSQNPELQRALNQVATVRAFGKLAVSVGSAVFVPATLGHVLTGINITSALTKEQIAADPKELAAANRARAIASGISAASFDALNANTHYDPWTLTAIWNSLATIKAAGRSEFARIAAGASSDLDAFYFLRVAQMIAQLPAVSEILPFTDTVVCVHPDGSLVLPLWLDYAIWTPRAEAAAIELADLAKSRGAPSATLLTTGSLSPFAVQRYTALGIATLRHAAVPGRP